MNAGKENCALSGLLYRTLNESVGESQIASNQMMEPNCVHHSETFGSSLTFYYNMRHEFSRQFVPH